MEINCLSEIQSLFLIWLTILNQSESTEKVLKNTLNLFRRLNIKNNYNNLNHHMIQNSLTEKPCLHRFPNKMSKFLYKSILIINEKFNGNACLVFKGDFKKNILLFDGIGNHKAELLYLIYEFLLTNKLDNFKLDLLRKICPKLSLDNLIEEIETINNLDLLLLERTSEYD